MISQASSEYQALLILCNFLGLLMTFLFYYRLPRMITPTFHCFLCMKLTPVLFLYLQTFDHRLPFYEPPDISVKYSFPKYFGSFYSLYPFLDAMIRLPSKLSFNTSTYLYLTVSYSKHFLYWCLLKYEIKDILFSAINLLLTPSFDFILLWYFRFYFFVSKCTLIVL